MKKSKIILTAVMALLLLSSACSAEKAPMPSTDSDAVSELTAPTEAPVQAAEAEKTDTWGRTVVRDGQTWEYNSRLRAVLFLGVDSRAVAEADEIVGNGGRADTIILFLIDPDARTVRMMPVSRDTMTQVDVYDADREYLFSGTMQLNMQYAFGDSPARSCQLMKRKISSLLHGIPIHSVCSLTLDGITAAVDLLGGIELTLDEDWTDIDPAYTAGAAVKMDARMVEEFLRYRDIDTPGSNNTRMARQAWFISRIIDTIGRAGTTELLLEAMEPFMESDVDGDTLKQMKDFTLLTEPIMIPGENALGRHDEFYIDDAALQELLLRELYTTS